MMEWTLVSLLAYNFPTYFNTEQELNAAVIIDKSLEAPIRQMARNAGLSEDMITSLVEKENGATGYDFKLSRLTNMIDEGIIDPAKVTRVALQNAVSVVSTLITTSNAIIEEKNKEKA